IRAYKRIKNQLGLTLKLRRLGTGKALLTKAGVDTETFTAYSLKHASVSKAYKRGVNVDTIRTAGWSSKFTDFANFYNRPIRSSSESF
ncbi:Protein of unknown function, partial [Cotesia congregata]